MTVPGTARARSLRKRQTDAEAKLWSRLRDRRLDGLKFRRQGPKGPFVVDFLCDAAMLIVELDGERHADGLRVKADARRTIYLKSLGYEVVRFWNAEVFHELESVLDRIHAMASARLKAPSSGLRPLSPQGEKATSASRERAAR